MAAGRWISLPVIPLHWEGLKGKRDEQNQHLDLIILWKQEELQTQAAREHQSCCFSVLVCPAQRRWGMDAACLQWMENAKSRPPGLLWAVGGLPGSARGVWRRFWQPGLPPAELCSLTCSLQVHLWKRRGRNSQRLGFPSHSPSVVSFSPEESAGHCSASHSSQMHPQGNPISQQNSASRPWGLHGKPPGQKWDGMEWNKSCRSPGPLGQDMLRSEERGEGSLSKDLGRKCHQATFTGKIQRKKEKKREKTTEHCWWQMLVEQDANCNQPLTKITGTDFVFYLENYLFAFAAIFFFNYLFIPSLLGDFFFPPISFLFRMIHASTGQLTDKCRQKCKCGDFSTLYIHHRVEKKQTPFSFSTWPAPINEFRITKE